jgi:UDP-glucose 4-epimerase
MTGVTLIIGGTGSLGKKLVQRWRRNGGVNVYSRDEAKHWTIRNELMNDPKVRFHVGDVRDKTRLLSVIEELRPSTIVVAAALKQVDTCELTPNESLMTNLVGTQNVIEAVKAARHTVGTVLFVSTDKACSPVNVYGMCKAMSERLITSQVDIRGTRWLCTRYGNVLESRGSIIPLFRYQAEVGQRLTVTDPDMTRFMMTLDEAVDLIEKTVEHAESGETWIPIIPSMRIGDLAELFADSFGRRIEITGLRPGEKLHEELINDSESVRTTPTTRNCYVIKPSHVVISGARRFRYSSDMAVLSKVELDNHLTGLGLLARPLADFDGKKIEEIVTNSGRQS